MAEGAGVEQMELLRAAVRKKPPVKPVAAVAGEGPVARVVVDVPLPHLDRLFDYAVPEAMAGQVGPGVRVRVRFAGQDVEGFVLERAETTEHTGRLTPLRKVVSPEPVLSAEVARLARAVADHYGGIMTDVLRLAVPPRHARAEQTGALVPQQPELPGREAGPWSDFAAGPAFLDRLAAGGAPRAVWTPLAGPGWAAGLVAAIEATAASGRGAVVVLPDGRDVDVLERSLVARIGKGRHARLEADLGPQARYRQFLALSRDEVRIAIGTRAAAFAPVRDLGLVAIWEDGDDAHVEQRAPYPHPREVLALRAESEGAAMLLASWSVTAEAAALLRSGWARPVEADRGLVRHRWPRVTVAGGEAEGADPVARGRLPQPAWRAAHDGLDRGPVLVQVPRVGYLPGTACQNCRKPARCEVCHGPMGLVAQRAADGVPAPPTCGWCARVFPRWTCPFCGDHRLRARSVGVDRTAEELGRAFAGVRVVVPRAGERTPPVPEGRTLVVATPGLEPPVEGGYAAALLLDGWVLLERPDLRSAEQTLARWRSVAALVRSADDQGVVVVCADPGVPAVQALVRADPAGFADRELDERTELGFPPAVTIASLTGVPAAVSGFADALVLPPEAEVLGPVPVEPLPGRAPAKPADPQVRLLVRVPRAGSAGLARLLHETAAARSARRTDSPVRLQIDPHDLV